MPAEQINNIPDGPLVTFDRRNYRVRITDEDTGAILYDHVSHGGQIVTVERYQVLHETGEIEGNQQHLMWGHPAVILHAFLQGREAIRKALKEPIFMQGARSIFQDPSPDQAVNEEL